MHKRDIVVIIITLVAIGVSVWGLIYNESYSERCSNIMGDSARYEWVDKYNFNCCYDKSVLAKSADRGYYIERKVECEGFGGNIRDYANSSIP